MILESRNFNQEKKHLFSEEHERLRDQIRRFISERLTAYGMSPRRVIKVLGALDFWLSDTLENLVVLNWIQWQLLSSPKN
jgi:hypothetical protein